MRPLVLAGTLLLCLSPCGAQTFSGAPNSPPWQAFSALALSPDGRTFVTGGLQGEINVWDSETGEWENKRDLGSRAVHSVVFLHSGVIAAAGDRGLLSVVAFDGSSPQQLDSGADGIRGLAWSGKTLFSAGDDLVLRGFQEMDGRLSEKAVTMTKTGHAGYIKIVFLSPDGHFLATAAEDGKIEIRSLPDSKLVRAWVVSKDWVRQAVWDAQGILTASDDGYLRAWTPEGAFVWKTPLSSSAASFAASGRLWAAGGEDGSISVGKRETGEILKSWKPHSAPVTGLVFLADRSLISCSLDFTIRRHDPATAKSLAVLHP